MSIYTNYIFKSDDLNTDRKIEIVKLIITFIIIHRRPIQR